MAHGWNPFFQSLPPPSSDSGSLRRTPESDGSLSQHTENFIGNHDFSGTAASQEAPVPHSSFNTNYYTNTRGEDSRTDCFYERYCQTQWQPDGEQLEKDYMQRSGNNNFPNFATDGSDSFNSSFTPDIQGLKQNCEMSSTSCLDDYSSVSSCSDTDNGEERPSCKFSGSDTFPKQKAEIVAKDSSAEFFFNDTGNCNFQSGNLCPNVSETNVFSMKTCARHNQSSTSCMMTATESETVLNGNDCGSLQDQEQKEDVEEKVKDKSYPDFLMTGNLTGVGIDQYPLDKEDDQVRSPASDLLDNKQSHTDGKLLKQLKNKDEGFTNQNLTADQHSVVSENVQIKINLGESPREESGSSNSIMPDKLKTLNSNSTMYGDKPGETDHEKKEIKIKVSESTDADHKLSECGLSSSSHAIECSLQLPEQQSCESPAQDSSCKIPPEMDVSKLTDLSVANLSETCLNSDNANSDMHSHKKMKKVEGSTSTDSTAKDFSPDLDCCGPRDTGSSIDTNTKEKKNVASCTLSVVESHSLGTDENMQRGGILSVEKMSLSPDLGHLIPAVTNDRIYEKTDNENAQDAAIRADSDSEACCSSTDVPSGIEMEITPTENMTPNCPALDDLSGSLTNDSDKNKSATSNPESCLKPNASGTTLNVSLEMGNLPEEETRNLSPNHCDSIVTSDGLSTNIKDLSDPESSILPCSSNTDLHPCLSKEWASPFERTSTTTQADLECNSQTLTSDKQSEFERNESCLQPNDSNANIKVCSEKEWTQSEENINSISFPIQHQTLHESFIPHKSIGPSAESSDDARESFEKLNIPTQDQSMHGLLYGEPLSGEDSSCSTGETNLVSSQHGETVLISHNDDNMDRLEKPAPQMTSSLQLRRLLHPVVILTNSESTKGKSSAHCCADCQHTSHTVDELIEHHCCSHPMPSFQYCKNCDIYLTNKQIKHFCDVDKEDPPLFSELIPVKKKDYNRFKCIKCKLLFSKVRLFVKHMRIHTGKTPYRCSDCRLYFAQACSLRMHKRIPGRCKGSKQPDKNPNAVFGKSEAPPQKGVAEKNSYERMKKCYVKLIDISNTNLCHLCGAMFASAKKAKKHYFNVHKGKKQAVSSSQLTAIFRKKTPQKAKSELDEKYKCPLCPRVFKYSFNRSRHLRDCIRNEISCGKKKIGEKYVCPLCTATFSSTCARYRHIKTICMQECINRLAKEKKLKLEKELTPQSTENMQKGQLKESEPEIQTLPVLTGSKVGLYKCNHCPAVFRHASGKYRHMKKHELTGKIIKYRHSVFSMSKPESPNKTKTEESTSQSETDEGNINHTLSCRFCEKSFSLLVELKKHERNHRGERPYFCIQCKKRFKQHTHLISHKKIHQKRYKCTVCNNKFLTVGELLQHRRSHLKRGKLQCPECPSQYDYPAHLLRHLKTHKNKDLKLHRPEVEMPPKQQQPLETVIEEKAPKQSHCSLCKKVFDDSNILRKHSLTHISKSSSNQCPFCKKQYPDRRNLLRHMVRHTGDKPFSCTNCGKQFYRAIYLKIHSPKCLFPQSGHHEETNPNKSFPCPRCPRSFNRKDRLGNHLESHKANRLLPCETCGEFYGKPKISIHQSMCGKTTKLSDDKLTSGKSEQSSTKISQNIQNTPSETSQNIHKTLPRSTASKLLPFKCPYCTQRFRYASYFLRHLVSHTGVQPYVCTRCGKRFKSQTLRLNHEESCDNAKVEDQSKPRSDGETKMDTLREEILNSPTKNEPEYKCKFCTKVFMKPRSLRRHILKHNEVKPYRCKACDSCFSRYDHLKVHQSHCSGKKTRLEVRIPKISLEDVGTGWQTKFNLSSLDKQETFNCEVCLKSFLTQSKLSRHITMFHSVKPFVCTRCGSAFSHEKTLKSHCKWKRCRKPTHATNASLTEGSNLPAETISKPPNRTRNRILLRIQPFMSKNFKYVCSYCPRSFKHSGQLNVHVRLHTGEKPYSCEYCNEKFIRKDYVDRHYLKCRKKHTQNKKLLCDGCGGFINNAEEHKHGCPIRHLCEYCGEKFLKKDFLVEHLLKCNKRPQNGNVLCDKCGGIFPEDKLEDHKKGCTIKPGTSSVPKSQQPVAQSPPKGFSCAYCSSRFLLFSQLQEHFLSTHKVETMNPPECTAPLQQLLSDIPNIKKEPGDEGFGEKHGDDGNAICKPDTAPNRDISPQFVCSECNMCFTNKAGLIGHQRVHTTGTPHNCKICNKGFWNKTQLRNHKRKCKLNKIQQLEGPLKAKIDFALHDSALVFKDSETTTTTTTDTEALQTDIPCNEESENESSKCSLDIQVQSSSNKEKKTVQYQCSECDQTFTDGLMLISHLEDHGREEQEKKQNICSICGKMCSSQGNLEKHMRIHVINQKYSCAHCSKVFPNLSELEKHKTSHNPNKPFICKLCQQRFWTRPAMCDHYRTEHADDVFYCQLCSKVYPIKKSLTYHYKKWHAKDWKDVRSAKVEKGTSDQQSSSHVSTNGESDDEDENEDSDSDSDSAPYFPCHVCGKTFPTSESLEDHQLCHLGEKPHECAECGKCFVHASQLQQHQRMHKSEFQCQTCGRGFVSLFALRTHKHTHGKSRQYRCSKCHLFFTGPTQLAEHMSTHREESFPCDICNKVFQSKSSRAEHRKSHSVSGDDLLPSDSKGKHEQSESFTGCSSDFRYRCGICRERFRDPEELSEHGCMEAKERPYSCTSCSQHFLHASHLKKHMNTHQPLWSEREYPCNQCNSSFSSSQNFLRHLKTHINASMEIKSNSLICPVCHLCFTSATELIHHFPMHPDNAPDGEKVQTDPSKSELVKRELLHSTLASEYECTKCGGTFLGCDAFRRHNCSQQQLPIMGSKYPTTSCPTRQAAGEEEEIDVTGEDLYTCNDCSMQFSSKSGLLEHQNTQHLNGRHYTCDHCGKTFAKRSYLKKHKSRLLLKELSNNAGELVVKKFECAQCTKTFNTSQDLSLHMRLHAEEQAGEYRCDMCYKSFSKHSLLRHHQESHVGEVVYECTECDKAFAFPHLLEEHQQTHARSSK